MGYGIGRIQGVALCPSDQPLISQSRSVKQETEMTNTHAQDHYSQDKSSLVLVLRSLALSFPSMVIGSSTFS